MPTLTFYEHLVPLGVQLEATYKNWQTDGLSIRFVDAKSRCAASIRHNQLAFEADIPEDYQTFVRQFRPLATAYFKLPHIKNVIRAGIRGQFLVKKGFSFEELVTLFEESFFVPAARRQSFLPGKMADLMFNVVLERDKHMVHVISGPVRKAELNRWTKQITYDLGEEAPEQIEYPEVAVLFDIDVYWDKITNPSETFDLLSAGAKTIADTEAALRTYLFPER